MSKNVKIRKGANIKLEGVAEKTTIETIMPSSFALRPTDFRGLVPKMLLKEGAEVKLGTPIFFNKADERIKFVSPVNGEIAEIVRGEKRKILEIRIVADKDQKIVAGNPIDMSNGDKIKEALLANGFWPFIKRRPYDIMAKPDESPKAIFVSGFDSAPLGADLSYILEGSKDHFQKGLDALAMLTTGKVHLGVKAGDSGVVANASNVEKNTFSGPHPAGNVGIQIHHIDPVNKGEVVWTVDAQAVAMMGRFLATSVADFSKTVTLAGSGVKTPQYLKSWIGASMSSLLDGRMQQGDFRIISGNVLSGDKVEMDGYLGFFSNVVTVIPEGREPQFLGWLAPNFHKFSLSHSYFSWLMPKKKYSLNTNLNGEDRAYVMSGQYEDVLPMDIYPVHLIKSIMTNDIEKMEALGIYEVAPEDFALCEFACTSKTPVQRLIMQGIDAAIEELG
jgi:Na+-transporting NADH:ubiquinone oxidoreductase subunit A